MARMPQYLRVICAFGAEWRLKATNFGVDEFGQTVTVFKGKEMIATFISPSVVAWDDEIDGPMEDEDEPTDLEVLIGEGNE